MHTQRVCAVIHFSDSALKLADAEAAKVILDRLFTAGLNRDRTSSTHAWKQWARRALDRGATIARRWCTAPLKSMPTIRAPGATDNEEVLESHTDAWQHVWKADSRHCAENVMRAVGQFRAEQVDENELQRYRRLLT